MLTLFFFRDKQVRYAATEIVPAKSARARGAYLRVSFKNTRETAQAINGWKLQRAVKFLENVKEKSEAVPMRRYCGSIGRTAQGTTRPDSTTAKVPAAIMDTCLGEAMDEGVRSMTRAWIESTRGTFAGLSMRGT